MIQRYIPEGRELLYEEAEGSVLAMGEIWELKLRVVGMHG